MNQARETLLKATSALREFLPTLRTSNEKHLEVKKDEQIIKLKELNDSFDKARTAYEQELELQKAKSASEYEVPAEEFIKYSSPEGREVYGDVYSYISKQNGFENMVFNKGTLDLKDANPEVFFKNSGLMTTTGQPLGWPVEIVRGPHIDWKPQVAVSMIDILPSRMTNNGGWKFMRETVYDNNATFKDEGAISPESALKYEEETGVFGTIMTWVVASNEQLEDAPFVQNIINQRLPLMIRQKLETAAINGNGVGPNPRGILNYGIGSESASGILIEQILREYSKIVSSGNGNPNIIAMRTADLIEIRLMKDDEENYMYGSPNSAVTPSIFGIPVVIANYLPSGNVLIGDTSHMDLVYGRGITLATSENVGQSFIAGAVHFRVSARMGVECRRPAAFTKITGVSW